MKNMVMALMFGAVLFGMSAATSWYLNGGSAVAESDTVEQPVEPDSIVEPTLAPDPTKVEKVAAMPVANVERPSITIEAVLQMSDAIKKTESKLVEREKRVKKEEQRVALLFKDLSREQDELEALSKGISQKIQVMEQAMDSMRESLETLDERKQELARMEKEAGVDEPTIDKEFEEQVNNAAKWFKNVEAQQAADFIKETANNGRLEFAAALINKMADRKVAQILGALDDPVLVQQLLDGLRINKKPKE